MVAEAAPPFRHPTTRGKTLTRGNSAAPDARISMPATVVAGRLRAIIGEAAGAPDIGETAGASAAGTDAGVQPEGTDKPPTEVA